MLARLEKKGYLKHQQDGQRYLYSATMSHAAAKRTALQQDPADVLRRLAQADDDGARRRVPVE